MKRILYTLAFFVMAFALTGVRAAGIYDFEGWTTPSVNQNGWKCTGNYDVEVVANPTDRVAALTTFQTQSLRISNARTTQAFGDQTFSAPLANEAGETTEAQPTSTPGTRQSRFEAQFDLASYTGENQQGLAISVSPDNGEGARMSYLRFEDQTDGIHVIFVEVNGTTSPVNFVPTDIATVDHKAHHTFKFVIDFIDGPSNDVVRIYIDGALIRLGTSWENYYRYDSESQTPNLTRAVNCLLFLARGGAASANEHKGFLIDNVALASGPMLYDFNGFFAPVNNSGFVNKAKAGSAIPVKFSLGGDKGLNIFSAGYPKVQTVECDPSLPTDAVEQTQSAGVSSLSYDPVTDQYTYLWKTDKSWKGCKQLVLVFTDGPQHSALFSFK